MILINSIVIGTDPKHLQFIEHSFSNKLSFRLSNPGCGGGGSLLYTLGTSGSLAGGYFIRYFFY
jgi:hypothetical protein